jgi:putative endonuclease
MTKARTTTELGHLGEAVVAAWLMQQGWQILYQRWGCRWGELDLVAIAPPSPVEKTLVFVEVKLRRTHNWDADGLLAITPQKQVKLWKAAELFLSEYPDLADLPCRFDVALVLSQGASRVSLRQPGDVEGAIAHFHGNSPMIHIGQPVQIGGHHLILHQYLTGVLEAG